MTNFLQRSLTGVLFVATVVGSILYHPTAFFLVCSLVAVLGMLEFKRLLEIKYDRISLVSALLPGLTFLLLVFLKAQYNLSAKWYVVMMPLIWAPFVHELFKKGENPFQRIAITLLVPLYVSIPLSFLYLIGWIHGEYAPLIPLGFFCLVWSNDTGAYLVGVSIGRTKLFERISPKKTWEGFIGGILFTFGAAYLIYTFSGLLSLSAWLQAGLIVSVFGTLGDLIESMLKRNVNIKDSGNLLPGHGGVLDRFDAVLFAAPMVYALFVLYGNF